MNDLLMYYNSILKRDQISQASYFEWNTYRVFNKLDKYNKLIPNFKLTIDGLPVGCAKPGVEDILIEYDEFNLLIECSLRSGETQIYYEGNSVTRHLKTQKQLSNKECFTLFLAPTVHYDLYKYYSINKYDTPIIPLTLDQFILLINHIYYNFSSFKFKKILSELLRPDLLSKDFILWAEFIDDYIKKISKSGN